MKSNNINSIYLILLFFIFFNVTSSAQNLRFSFDVTTGANFSDVNYYVEFPSNGAPLQSEAIFVLTCAVFYDNTKVMAASFQDAPLGWDYDGSFTMHNSSNSIPGYTGYAELIRLDATENGTVILEGAPKVLLTSVRFTHLTPGINTGNAFLAGTENLGGIQYGSSLGDGEHDIIITGAQSAPLPISIKSFDAIKHSASSAKLDWTTSKEVNSDYFGIERSIDGSTWDEIARVKAAGDSNVDIAYDYIDDRLPLSRTNGQVFYYRLRMTDLDGAFKFSDVRGVNFDKQALGPISIYPNPTTEIVNIDLSEVVMEDGDVYVSVYDMSGRLVMTKQIIGSGIELIKVDQLPSDAYNFIIRQGEQIHQQRVIKID